MKMCDNFFEVDKSAVVNEQIKRYIYTKGGFFRCTGFLRCTHTQNHVNDANTLII
jgi:hypothetical protein